MRYFNRLRNKRKLAIKHGIIFVPATVRVEWGDIPPTRIYRMKRIKRFGKSKTNTQRNRAHYMGKRGG